VRRWWSSQGGDVCTVDAPSDAYRANRNHRPWSGQRVNVHAALAVGFRRPIHPGKPRHHRKPRPSPKPGRPENRGDRPYLAATLATNLLEPTPMRGARRGDGGEQGFDQLIFTAVQQGGGLRSERWHGRGLLPQHQPLGPDGIEGVVEASR